VSESNTILVGEISPILKQSNENGRFPRYARVGSPPGSAIRLVLPDRPNGLRPPPSSAGRPDLFIITANYAGISSDTPRIS